MASALRALGSRTDRTALFATDGAPARSRCPTRKKVKAVAVEAFCGGIAGACIGGACSVLFNLTFSPCTVGMGCLQGLLAGSIAGAVSKISANTKHCAYTSICCRALLGSSAGVPVGIGIGAGFGDATAAMGCEVGPLGGLASGMIVGGVSGLMAPLLRMCVSDAPDPYIIDIDYSPTTPPTARQDPRAEEL